MRPLKLEFEGINSFSEHTIIDFESLIKSGIFGIFGDTGSGKSTILDCINFALYGKVERSKEKTDIINYRCYSASVKFTFDIINGGKRRTYYIERSIKKDKNGTHKALLYEDGICIAEKTQEVEKKIIEILGVEAEDFRKCIALPQGEFAQFVKSAPRERLALIERLFSLSKYGDKLKEKINERESKIDGEYATLTGALSGYTDIDEKSIETLSDRRQAGGIRLEELSKVSADESKNFDKLKFLYEKKIEAASVEQKLAALNEKKSAMEELRKEISVLPICREAVACEEIIGDTEKQIKANSDDYNSLKVKAEEVSKKSQIIEKRLKDGDFEKRIDELTKLSAKYQTCEGKPEKLIELGRELEKKREEYKEAEKSSAQINSEAEKFRAQIAELEKLIGGYKSDDLDTFVNVEFKGAVLRSEYVNSLEYFSELGVRLEPYDDGSELYKFIKDEVKEQVALYKQRVYDVKDFKLENASLQFDILQKAIKDREKNAEKLREISLKLSEAESRLKLNANVLATLKKDGVVLRKSYDELASELSRVFGENCRDYAEAERANSLALKNLKEEFGKLNLDAENCREESNRINIAFERNAAEREALKARKDENTVRLEKLIKSSGFHDIDECKALAEKFSAYADAERALKEFDDNFAAISARYDELKSVEGIETVSEEALEEARNRKEFAENARSELLKELAVLDSRIEETKIKLDEKKELLKQFRSVEKEKNLVSQLKEVTRNNRFLEFIANEYLCDISSMASNTLLKLTDGRYFLTYKENNFNIGDNFDCGNLRGVNTLSGGETFLVSLSLALALSQTICASSLKSIEFFFLDEGFGTLDGALLDTVMTALEKLKSSRFTIGVISHVEELKHRIDNKIIVQKATESHGSTVQTSC